MALVRTGSIVGAVSGALGSVVFARQGGSAVVRVRPLLAKRVSERVSDSRFGMSEARAAWFGLSDDLRLRWEDAALQWNAGNRLGVSRKVSGRTLFIMCFLRIGDLSFGGGGPVAGPEGLSDAVPSLNVFPGDLIRLDVVSPTVRDDRFWHLFLQRTFRVSGLRPGRLERECLAVYGGWQSYDISVAGRNGFLAGMVIGEGVVWRAYTHAIGWPTKAEYSGLAEVLDVGPELVVNGTMETLGGGGALTGWIAGGGASFDPWMLDPFSGVRSGLYIAGAGAGTKYWSTSDGARFALVGGSTYRLRWAYRVGSGNCSGVTVSGAGMATIFLYGALPLADGLWHTAEATFVASGSAALCRLGMYNNAGVACSIEVDNLSIRKEPA